MDIEYPEKPNAKNKALASAKAAAEQIPWIGAAIAALGPILPDHIEADRDRWHREVTDRLNFLARLHSRPTISRDSLGWLIALLNAKIDEDGVGEAFISHEEWECRFPNATRVEIEEALADLSYAGWIQTRPDANSPSGIGGFCGTSLLFAHTHPWIHQLYPSEDAKLVASYALENADPDADAVSAMKIAEHFQWRRRRLYPALAFLADEILPQDSLERHYHPEYPFIWLRLNGEVRRVLRGFIASGTAII